jgi:23S rRNA (guanine2445-N2)-methyltransferase / 23S rRNA (guanine2069-N7)-methyltransferase
MSQAPANVPTFPLIAKTFFGLEGVLAHELTALGAHDVAIGRRMVSFSADQALMYRANLWCRTAVRILRPIAEFTIDAQAADCYRSLYAQVQEVDWAAYLLPTSSLAIDPVVHGQVLTNSLYTAQVAKDAIVDWFRDRYGERPSVDRLRPDLRINLHVSGDRGIVYLDSSGQSLHKRGYRRQIGAAPLNEVLAAGILRLSGWDGCSPLVDFLCGSGTLPIEAALIARNRAPGLLREDFGYRRWLDFNAGLETQAIEQARASAQSGPDSASPSIFGSDLDPAAIDAAGENATRAGASTDIQFQVANFENLEPPAASGTIIINPPYDLRLKVAGVGAFYRRLSRALAQRWQGYTAWVLAGNLEAAEQFDLVPTANYPLRNGPIDCRLLRFDLDGSQPVRNRIAQAPAEKPVSATRSSPAEALRNRLVRMGKHWARWARRQEISCYRIYDCDLPEVPWTIDRYEDRLQIVEHESPHGRSQLEHRQWFDGLLAIVGEALDTPLERIHAHPHELEPTPRDGARSKRTERFNVAEAGCKVEVDLGRRDDTGLAPDLRTLRDHLATEATGKRFLNLFGRSGVATVRVGTPPGNARMTVTVEPGSGLARWSQHNFELNGLGEPDHVIVQAEPIEWLERLGSTSATPFDLMLVAPAGGFHRRHDTRAWNPREEYRQLLDKVRPLLAEGGKIYFVTTVRRFRLDPADVPWATTRDVTAKLLSPDCRTKPSLRCWSLVRTD